MARKKRSYRRRKSLWRVAKGIVYTGAVVAPGAIFYLETKDAPHTILRYAGIGTDNKFQMDHLAQMWLPVGAVAVVDWATSALGLQQRVSRGIGNLVG